MHLENDSFTINYDPTRVSVAAILEKIRGLGYKPEEMVAVEPDEDHQKTTTTPLPKLIASALAAAVEEDKLLLLDFHAGWCAPCQILEKEVFTDTDVKHALEDYLLIKVDTDRYPEVAEYFKIRALPTLIAIDGNSVDRYRYVGLIGVTELVRDLANALRQQEGMD